MAEPLRVRDTKPRLTPAPRCHRREPCKDDATLTDGPTEMKRVTSLQQLKDAALGPTQHMSLGSKAAKGPPERAVSQVWALVVVMCVVPEDRP